MPRLRRTTTWSSGGREIDDVLRSVSGKAVAEQKASSKAPGAVTPEDAVQRLLDVAGPGAGSPPPEVVGAALKAMSIDPTSGNVRRALQTALGGAAPTAAQVAVALQAATDGMPDLSQADVAGGPDAAAASIPKPSTPEEVISILVQTAGPSAGRPPADVVGTALRKSGLEITAENVLRALKAANPDVAEPSSKDLGDALKAAMQQPGPGGYGVGPTSSQLPGATPATGATPAAGSAVQTPEEVVRALLQIAGPAAGQAPPEVLGTALRAAGLPVTRDNVLRALRAAGVGSPTEEDVQKGLAGADEPLSTGAGPGGPGPSPEEVIFALRMAAGPGAGTPPPEVVGAALHQAKVSPLSAEAVVRALKEAGHTAPSPEVVQAALQAAVTGKFDEKQ